MAENLEFTEVEETTELATAPEARGEIVSFADNIMVDVAEQGYYATFPVETMGDKKKLYAARNDNQLLRDYMGVSIEVADFVLDVQQVNDAESGVRKVPCVHIVAADGTVYQSSSTGVVKSVIDIISSFGLPSTWDDTLEVVCKETNTAQGYRYKYLATV